MITISYHAVPTSDRFNAKVIAATKSAKERGADRYTAPNNGSRPTSSCENCRNKNHDITHQGRLSARERASIRAHGGSQGRKE